MSACPQCRRWVPPDPDTGYDGEYRYCSFDCEDAAIEEVWGAYEPQTKLGCGHVLAFVVRPWEHLSPYFWAAWWYIIRTCINVCLYVRLSFCGCPHEDILNTLREMNESSARERQRLAMKRDFTNAVKALVQDREDLKEEIQKSFDDPELAARFTRLLGGPKSDKEN
jgi:hypothetical protein